MKTTSTRFKAAAQQADQPRAVLSLIVGLLGLSGGVYVFYQLVLIFTVFTGGDVMPYVYYSLAFAGLMFVAVVGFHYYGALKIDRAGKRSPKQEA
jgi:hypothetical protein